VRDGLTLGEELIGGLLDAGLRDLVVEGETSDWSVLSWGGRAWEGEHDALWHVVELSVALEGNGLPLLASKDPVAHVVDGGVSGRGSTGELSELDDLGTALLDAWGELVGDPAVVNHGGGGLSSDSGVSDVWVHGWGVVAPDGHLLDVGDLGAGLESELSQGAVVVETGHGSEVLGWEVWSVVLANHSVGVGWVSDNDGLGVTVAVVVDGLANIDEDLAVVLEQVSAFHAWAAWLGTNKEVVLNILEGDREVASANDIVEEREGAIVQFSLDSLEDLLLEGQVEQVEDDTLVLSEEFATIILR
jgi:hypothetical protein